MGRITPFQAQILESASPRSLAIGPCLAVKRLGGATVRETILATQREGGEQCVTKILRASGQLPEESLERLEELVLRGKHVDHASIVVPFSCVRVENDVVLVSRFVPGPHLGELLVRRGRFPARVAWEIGRQLAGGLETLVAKGLVHGDIRAANVRLTKSGTAVLVDAGVRPAIDPVLTVHSGLAPERYDGVAPELIGGSATPDMRSEAYALGCLLWQLLAGRPPFPAGDPLVKLASHQTRVIDDVRKWAPDTPAALAEGIRRLTARNPADRPATFAALLEDWHRPGRGGRRCLAGFRRRFDAPARAIAADRSLSTPTRWLVMLTLLFAVSGGVATLVDRGARNVVLAWAQGVSAAAGRGQVPREVNREEGKPRHAAPVGRAGGISIAETEDETGIALPAADPLGVILLEGAGPYRPDDITVVGNLTIVGKEGSHPQILIAAHPLKLCAESVRLSNVQIRSFGGRNGESPALNALLLVQAQELTVEGCLVESGPPRQIGALAGPPPHYAPATGPALIAWKLLDRREHSGQIATIRNSLLLGDGPALYLAHAVRQVEFDNVLKIGSGPLVQLATSPAVRANVELRLKHTTCRSSGAILRWLVPEDGPLPGRVLVDAADCVFDVASPRAALFELAGPKMRPEWLGLVRMAGEGSVASPALETAAWISTASGQVEPLEASAVELEGIVSGPFRFAGNPSVQPADSEVEGVEAPRRTTDPPGIRARALPGS